MVRVELVPCGETRKTESNPRQECERDSWQAEREREGGREREMVSVYHSSRGIYCLTVTVTCSRVSRLLGNSSTVTEGERGQRVVDCETDPQVISLSTCNFITQCCGRSGLI